MTFRYVNLAISITDFSLPLILKVMVKIGFIVKFHKKMHKIKYFRTYALSFIDSLW